MKTLASLIALLTLLIGATVASAQKVEVKGGYNGWGYQPGYTLDLNTGWARVNGAAGGFNFRPSSGYTSPLPTPPRTNGYPVPQPRVQYNYGRPYIAPNPSFRPEPRGGWYRSNW